MGTLRGTTIGGGPRVAAAGRQPQPAARINCCGCLSLGYHRGVNTYWHVALPPLCA
ncbi:hypothetical protein Scel_04510 [Streptomyces cellostaticus]|nr:hypothetical protein Scel_04510 [Streptomyces cellostaticus]